MDIGKQIDEMLEHHRKVLKDGGRSSSSSTKVTCTMCDSELENLCYRVFKNRTRHLCGMCPKHGFTFKPYVKGLDIPVIDKRVKSKRKRGAREARQETMALFNR